MNRKLSICLCALVCLAAGAATPGWAVSVVPPEWGGIWESTDDTFDCDTNALMFSSASTDTLCPGAVFGEPPVIEEITFTCTSSADGDSYTTHCEGSTEMIPGCLATYVIDTVGTRTGETSVSTTTFSTTFVGACFGMADTCQRTESTSTRIAGPPESCVGTPNEGESWGTLKARYR